MTAYAPATKSEQSFPVFNQVNCLTTRTREHSRKPDEIFPIIETCSPGPRLELFARGVRTGWSVWGRQAEAGYEPTWDTCAHNSTSERRQTVLPIGSAD